MLFGFTDQHTDAAVAMVLAIGLVVDDAIVMLENIFRHVEKRHAAAGSGDHRRARDRLRDRRP
jgi:Cu/Ag efflux pump CusA